MVRSYPHYDYDLADELVEGMQQACGVEGVVQTVTESLQNVPDSEVYNVAEGLLGQQGIAVGQKCLELGQKYKDRTAEVMEEVAAKTGITFPSIPQRYLEIAILCSRPQDKWSLNAANVKELTYSVKECSLYKGFNDNKPDVAAKMPCISYCSNLAQTIFDGLDIPVKNNVLANMAKNGYCRFQFLKK